MAVTRPANYHRLVGKEHFMKTLTALGIGCALLCGCREDAPKIVGSGVSKTETRAVSEFTQVSFRGQGRLELKAGPLEPLTITGDDNIVPLITTAVEGQTLTIRPTEKNLDPDLTLVIQAASPVINQVECLGAGDIILQGVEGDDVRVSVTGAGSVRATGKAIALHVSSEGAGKIDTTGLEAERVTVVIAGAGSAEVSATKNLDVTINGAASVRYTGDPIVTKQISGIGTVRKK
jgi:hypothetical protein